jgi:hypothetical protein
MTMRTPYLLMMKQADIGFPARAVPAFPMKKFLDKMYIIEWQMKTIVLNSSSQKLETIDIMGVSDEINCFSPSAGFGLRHDPGHAAAG